MSSGGVFRIKSEDIVRAAVGDEFEVTVDSLGDGVFGFHGFGRYSRAFSVASKFVAAGDGGIAATPTDGATVAVSKTIAC